MQKLFVPENTLIDNPRDGLERVMQLCMGSSQYTRRTSHIHEVAMQAMGLTKSQRDARHESCFKYSKRVIELRREGLSSAQAKKIAKEERYREALSLPPEK
jgi:hypothetical protein